MKMSRKIAWAAACFTILVLAYCTVKPGQQEEFVPLSQYNERFSDQTKEFVPLSEYNEIYSNQDEIP